MEDRFHFPGGVCPVCGHTPLEVKTLSNEGGTWFNAKWSCTKCGASEFLKRSDTNTKNDAELQKWARKVIDRDNGCCVICGETRDLDAHHLISKTVPELKYRLSNGVTLCRRCHKLVHSNTYPWPEKYK